MPLPTMGGSKEGKGKGAGAGKGERGDGSEGAVLPGPKTPHWACGCGFSCNWACRTRCKMCATWAPKNVLAAARHRAKAAAGKADKENEDQHREKEKERGPLGKGAGRRPEEAPIPEDSSEMESGSDNGMDIDGGDDAMVSDAVERKALRALLKHTGLVEAIDRKVPGVKAILMQKARTPEPETPYKRNLEEACRRRSRIETDLARKRRNYEAAQAATKAAQAAEAAAKASLDSKLAHKCKVDAEITALAIAEVGLPGPGSPIDLQQVAQSAEKFASALSDPGQRREAGIPDKAIQRIRATQAAILVRAAKKAEGAQKASQAEGEAARAPAPAPGTGSPSAASSRGSSAAASSRGDSFVSVGEQSVEEAFSGFDLGGLDQQALQGIKRELAERLPRPRELFQATQMAISEQAAKEVEEAREARQAEADAARAPTPDPGAGSPDAASGRGGMSAREAVQAVEEAFSGVDLDGMDQQALEGIKRRTAERLAKSFSKKARAGPARSRSRSAASSNP